MNSEMSSEMKSKIAVLSINALFEYGLPAMAKVVTSLSNKDVVTNEDIDKIGQDMRNAEDYFK